MRQPGCVLWALTKNNSAFKVQQKGDKSRNQCFSKDPLNLTGLHNQSSAGFTAEQGLGLTVNRAASKSGKSFRREYELRVAHKSHHRTAKVNGNSDAGLNHSTQTIRRGTQHAARAIQGLTFATSAKKQLLLRRLARLHVASRDLAPRSQ